jgi:thymidylate kinase
MTDEDAEPTALPPLLRAAFEALDRADVAWALLRGTGPASTSGDVDILVEPAAAGRLDALLADAGYRRLPGAGQGSHRFYVGYDVGRDTFVMLDVVTEVAFGRRLEFLAAAAPALLARARRVGRIAVLHADDAFWHLLLHYLLDKRRVPPGGHERLARAAAGAAATGALATVIDGLRPAGMTAADVLDLVRRGEQAAVESLSADLRRRWRAGDRHRIRSRTIRSRLQRAHLLGPAGPRPIGMSIAILGPDGAGKTTLADGLAASVPLPNRQVYMGVWRDYPWDRRLRFVPGARLGMRLARLAIRSAQCRYHRLRGRLVLLDRFTYDAALPTPELDWRGRVTAALVRRLSRDPDLVLVLDAPAEIMYARKGEQGVPVLARDRRSYLDLAAKHPAVSVIDATLAPSGVRRQAHVALWRAVAELPRKMA